MTFLHGKLTQFLCPATAVLIAKFLIGHFQARLNSAIDWTFSVITISLCPHFWQLSSRHCRRQSRVSCRVSSSKSTEEKMTVTNETNTTHLNHLHSVLLDEKKNRRWLERFFFSRWTGGYYANISWSEGLHENGTYASRRPLQLSWNGGSSNQVELDDLLNRLQNNIYKEFMNKHPLIGYTGNDAFVWNTAEQRINEPHFISIRNFSLNYYSINTIYNHIYVFNNNNIGNNL